MVKMNMDDLKKELSGEEIQELEAAENKFRTLDEDCSEMTHAQLLQFKRTNHQKRTKPTISLRISPATLDKAKKYGKGYTGLLSRFLDVAINDDEMVRKMHLSSKRL